MTARGFIPKPIRLRGGGHAADPRLGRVPEFDERSRDYPVTRSLQAAYVADAAPIRRTWRLDGRLDQEQSDACTGHAWTHEHAAEPKRHKPTSQLAFQWYDLARKLDGLPDEDGGGSTTLGAAKAGVRMGYFDSYEWCFTLEDVLLTISHLGCVVVGTVWRRGMFSPSREGIIHPTGPDDGGHEYLLRGYDPRRGLLVGSNSWGESWGRKGDFLIPAEQWDVLRRADGDACYPVRRS